MVDKITVIAFFFKPTFGGASTRSTEIVRMLKKMTREVVVITTFPQYPSGKIEDPKYWGITDDIYIERDEDVTIIRIRLPPLPFRGLLTRFFLFSIFALKVILNLGKIGRYVKGSDVIYSHTPQIVSMYLGWLLSKLFGADHITDIQDLLSLELRDWNRRGILARIFALIAFLSERLALKLVKRVSTATISLKIAVEKIFGKNKKNEVIWIPTPIALEYFQERNKYEARDYVMNKLRLVPEEFMDKKMIVYTGFFGVYQGLTDLIKVIARIRDKLDNVCFVLMGDGETKKKVISLIRKLKLNDVIYVGKKVPRELVPWIISMADICLLPLKGRISKLLALPTKFYEYVACSRPVIAISSGDVRAIIEKFKVGLVMDSIWELEKKAKELEWLLLNDKVLEEYCRRAKVLARWLFLEENIIEKFSRVLEGRPYAIREIEYILRRKYPYTPSYKQYLPKSLIEGLQEDYFSYVFRYQQIAQRT